MWHRLIPRISRSAPQSFLAIITLAGLTFVCFRLQLNISTAGFLYLIVIVLLSLAGDYVASVVTSVVAAMCLTYFFAPPIFSIRVYDPLNIIAIIAFLTTSLVISRLVSEVRTRSAKLHLNEYSLSEGQRLAHMGSWAFNAAGFDYWSSELFRIHGLHPRGKPPSVEEYLALVHPEDRASMQQGITQMLADHRAFDFTKRIVRSDGEIRHVRCVSVPVTQGGIFQCFLGTGMDVTEQEQLTEELRRRETEELRRREKELRDVIDTIPAIVWSALPDGSSTYVNKRFVEYTGLSAEQVAGSGWQAIVHPDDLERIAGQWKEAVTTGKPHEFEVRSRRSDGQYRWQLDRGVPLRDEDGNIVKWYGVTTDIEDRKRAEQECEKLRQLEADLAHIDRVSMLGEMAASLAHEIKQPISAAITSANSCMEWLAHQPPNLDRARAAAAKIDKYGNRAAEIIDRIRSLYKKSPPQRELVDVNGIIEEMLTLLKGEARRASIAMRTELAAELPEIVADRVQLQQVFMNLMLNAIEAMKDSGGELTVKSQLQDGQLQFSVSDTGVGLPMEKMDQIFSAFFTTKPQGSGMGLAISRSIVESHGGRLWATANDGRGATFHFTLPTEVTEPTPLVA
jgi:PAS domain S-box-containing protein